MPNLVQDLSSIVTTVVVDWMNLRRQNNWKAFARQVWPKLREVDLEIRFEEGRMSKVLLEWGTELGKTADLLTILVKLQRWDVLEELEKELAGKV